MTTSKGIRAKDYPSQFSSVADAINLESKIVIGVHIAEGEPVELTKVEGSNPVKFE